MQFFTINSSLVSLTLTAILFILVIIFIITEIRKIKKEDDDTQKLRTPIEPVITREVIRKDKQQKREGDILLGLTGIKHIRFACPHCNKIIKTPRAFDLNKKPEPVFFCKRHGNIKKSNVKILKRKRPAICTT